MASGKKNYFRHSFFAHNDTKLLLLRDAIGVGFYFYYFSLLEQCGEQASEVFTDEFEFHDSRIRSLWCVNLKKSERIANEMHVVGLLEFEKREKTFWFRIPKFAKYLGKYQTKITPNTPNKRKEKEIKRNKIKINKKTCDFEIEKIYDAYPKKAGKKIGIEKLKKIVTTQQIFDEILQGATNYAKYCTQQKIEKQYIKQFSTWVNQECWNDDYEIKSSYPKMFTTLNEDEIW